MYLFDTRYFIRKTKSHIINFRCLGPSNYTPRVLPPIVAVYREGGATLTPAHPLAAAPPAHATQPSSVIH